MTWLLWPWSWTLVVLEIAVHFIEFEVKLAHWLAQELKTNWKIYVFHFHAWLLLWKNEKRQQLVIANHFQASTDWTQYQTEKEKETAGGIGGTCTCRIRRQQKQQQKAQTSIPRIHGCKQLRRWLQMRLFALAILVTTVRGRYTLWCIYRPLSLTNLPCREEMGSSWTCSCARLNWMHAGWIGPSFSLIDGISIHLRWRRHLLDSGVN